MACMTKYRCKLHLQVTLIQIKHANLNSLKWNLHSDTILPGQMSSQIRFLFEMVHKQKHQDLKLSTQNTNFPPGRGLKRLFLKAWKQELKFIIFSTGIYESSQLTELSELKTSQSNFSFKIIFLKIFLLFWVLKFF